MARPKPSLLIAALTIAGLLVGIQVSTAAPSSFKKTFGVSLSGIAGPPYTLTANTDYSLTFTMTNTTKGPQAFGSAQITAPAGITVTGASATTTNATATFTAHAPSGGVVLVTSTGPSGSGVLTGGTLAVTLAVTTGTSACPPLWGVRVKQSNDFSGTGNDFVTTDSVSTPIGQGSLAWTTQPSTTEYDVAMGTIAGSAPVVTATGPCGDAIAAPSVTLSDTASHLSTTGGPSSSGSTVTFTNVKFSTYDFTDQLVASAAGFASATSNAFDVVEKLGVCTSSSCDPLHVTGTQTNADLSLSFDGSPRISTASHTAPTALCSGETGFVGSSVSETFTVNSDSSKGKTVKFTVSKTLVNAISNNGAPFMAVCMFDPTTNTGTELPDCTSPNGTFLNNPPCVVGRGKNAANEVVTVSLPAGDPKLNLY